MKSGETKFNVDLKAGDMTEIFVVGDGYRLLDRGVGNLKAQLPHGRYLVKLRKGAQTSQQAIRVNQDMEVTLENPDQMYGIEGSSISSKESVARRVYAEMHLGQGPSYGNGTALVLFEDNESDLGRGRGLKLLDSRLKTIAELQPRNARQAVLRQELKPGHYYLSAEIQFVGRVCMALEVFPGMQTQIYLERQKAGGPQTRRREADLASAQVGLVSHTAGLGEMEFLNMWDATQTAAQSLALLRPTPPESILNSHLYAKFQSPLLGLLGIHLLLATGQPSESLVDEVLNNLRSLMPDSADVAAVEVIASRKFRRSSAKLPRINVPPLLRASWDVFLNADHRRSEGAFGKNSVAANSYPVASAPTPWFLWSPQAASNVAVDGSVIERIRSSEKVPGRGIAVQRVVKGISSSTPVSKAIGEIAQSLKVPRQQVPAYLVDLESALEEE